MVGEGKHQNAASPHADGRLRRFHSVRAMTKSYHEGAENVGQMRSRSLMANADKSLIGISDIKSLIINTVKPDVYKLETVYK